jgi:uncharacterized membrane protein
MNLTSLLIAVLVVVLLGSVPAWPYSRSWGYGPSSIVGALLAILLVLALRRPGEPLEVNCS